MRISVDRLCELAGVRRPNGLSESKSRLMREGIEEEMHEMEDEGMGHDLDEDEGMGHDLDEEDEGMGHDDMDEMIEIDEADLVKELRRARVLMRESKKVELEKKRNIQEAQLKGIIDQEVKNVLQELEMNGSSWVYGDRKPRNSKKGYTHHGSFLKGIGFK